MEPAETLVVLAPSIDPEPWIAAFAAAAPWIAVRRPGEAGAQAARYALAWKPGSGAFAGYDRLEVIFSLGAGVDGVLAAGGLPDLPVVRMVEPGLTRGMVEYAVASVLYWHRDLHDYARQQRAGVWKPLPQRPADERTVGILGLGELGTAAAAALRALGFPVAGWSRRPRALPDVVCLHGPEGLDAVLQGADILVALLPSTPDTRGLLDGARMRRMPAGSVIVNAGRGDLIVLPDLLALLDCGHLKGATLDVFPREPLPADHPLWSHPRAVVTPHVAAETLPGTAVPALLRQIERHRAGQPLEGVVDRDRGY